MLRHLTIAGFIDETASDSPAPGGGSVSALAASLGAALTSMVCRLTINKKKYLDVQAEMEEILKKSEQLRTIFAGIIDEDSAAFSKVISAYRLPKETSEQEAQRNTSIQEAIKSATVVPLKLMESCIGAIELVKIAAVKGNQNSLSDAGVAALMLKAGCEGAALNVKINLTALENKDFAANIKSKVEQTLSKVSGLVSDILIHVNKALS